MQRVFSLQRFLSQALWRLIIIAGNNTLLEKPLNEFYYGITNLKQLEGW